MKPIQITAPYITLGQLLKRLGVISTGGEAKYFLQDHPIEINGINETRRGRKIVVGDVLVIVDETYQVVNEIH